MSPPRDGESPSDGPVDDGQSGHGPVDDGQSGHGPTEPPSDGRSAPEPDPATPNDPAADGATPATGERDGSVSPNGGAGTVDAPVSGPAEPESREGGGLRTFVVDVVSSALAVLLVGALLFAVSGVWPPMVAVESPSMTPHMKTGDLVFVMEEQRFPGDGAVAGTGVVTAQTGETTDYRKFARSGDVIVYEPDGRSDRTPIIHRAMFWVEEGENWYDRADRQSVGRYSECGDSPSEAMPNCPAPHDGFVTKGDANGVYDQVQGLSSPVRSAWVIGTAEVRIPKLGCIRLRTEGCASVVRAATGSPAVTPTANNRTASAP